jgi:hypothetical protein
MKTRLPALLLLWGIAVMPAPGWAQRSGKPPESPMCDCGVICTRAKSGAKCKVDRCNGKPAAHTRSRKNARKKSKKPTRGEVASAQ